MNDDDDNLNLVDDTHHIPRGEPWKILIVDDEPEVHDITTVALSDFTFANCGIEFIHAYSGEEATKIVDETDGIAVMLVDVVMEHDYAGLDFVRYVREVAKRKFVRIILRTGQPGQAPERKVITEFDINDYKQKTELTQDKMFSIMHTSIASYRDLMALDSNRRGLQKVIEASAEIFQFQSMEHFAQGVLEQLTALLYLDKEALILRTDGLAAEKQPAHLHVIAGTGRFSELVGKDADESLPPDILDHLTNALAHENQEFGDGYFVTVFTTTEGVRNVIYISGDTAINHPDRELIELFCANVGKAQDNLRNIINKLHAAGLD